jgi:hypothetical protein
MLLTAWKLAEVEKGGSLDDSSIVALFQREAKARRETIADAERAGRLEARQAAEAELAYLSTFLPKPFTESELRELASATIQQVGATGPSQVGIVMKTLMPTIQGRADGKTVSQVVQDLLKSG